MPASGPAGAANVRPSWSTHRTGQDSISWNAGAGRKAGHAPRDPSAMGIPTAVGAVGHIFRPIWVDLIFIGRYHWRLLDP